MSTFKSKDVPLDALRDTGRVLMEASRTALKRPTVDGYVQKLETSFEDFSNLYHPHVHAILDTPAGGRGFIPRAAYEHEWLRALPSHLHPLADAVYSEPARDVEACCTYIAKSPFHKKSSAEEVARTVEAIRAHKGLLKTAYRGSLDEQETAHCAAA